MARQPTRGDIIATLNRLVQEGVITHFQTSLHDRHAEDRSIVQVSVADPTKAGEALRDVRKALEPLGFDLTLKIDFRE